jgi:DNA mismatch repair protein MutS2
LQAKIGSLLEFDKITRQLADCAVTSMAKRLAEQLAPATVLDEVQLRLRATDEACKVERIKGGVSFSGISDISEALKRSLIGAMLSTQELYAVAQNVDGARRLRRQLCEFDEQHEIALLAHFAEQMVGYKELSTAIRACIDEHGQVLDQASVELTRIRQEIRAAESRVREKLEQMIRSSSVQKMLQDVLVTIRNERYVLPVKAEYRSSLNGIIHDQSASGATLFIEPEAVVQLNNRMKELKLREEREIEVILYRLSALVADVAGGLEIELDILAQLDFVFAKAKLAAKHKASLPLMNDVGWLRLRKARHPLLNASHVVPLDIQLGREFRGIVVTGPNTGGKTVALKTVGLLTLMAMSGLFVPAEDDTELAVFHDIFADIGDEQSIEQNLSTFSGHMRNMIAILRDVDERSLVLLDEMGAGTDPTEGAALAIAILDYLQQRTCRFIATTHYSSLKAYAEEQSDIVNASVEFDVQTLQPTYRMLIGVPGRSNALAIAERLGLPDYILATARQQLSEDEQRVDRMLGSLEQQRVLLEQQQREFNDLQQKTAHIRSELESEQQRLHSERERMLEKARHEAKSMLHQAKAEAEQIITDLRKLAAQQRTTASAPIKEHQWIEERRRLDQLEQKFQANDEQPQAQTNVDQSPLTVGDEVFVSSFGQKGIVAELINERELVVQIGAMRSRVKRAAIQKLRSATPPHQQKSSLAQTGVTIQRSAQATVKLELDVRGMTLDDALMEVDRYLSDVVLAGLTQVLIIHGVGTGVLRKGIQQHLKNHRHIKSQRPGRYGEGDLGVTVVEMK